jgi:tetraacyldisaccharide 4'-kinase
MRAPAFWARRTPSPLANLLRPVASLYGAVAARRLKQPGDRAPVPVVCVGNFTVGGAGKTPTALALARILKDLGHRPALLTRGFGGRLAGPVQVDPGAHSPAEVGDEPLLLVKLAPTVVSRDRPAGARLCVAGGASVIVMDDGLQNPSLVKDVAITVVDGVTGIGNGLCLPAGPLRAPLSAQWPLADAVIVIGKGDAGEAVAQMASTRRKPILWARLEPHPEVAKRLAGERVFAFAGIARPEKFFATLRECEAVLVRTQAFPDHHAYRARELETLARQAQAAGARLVTTEKDLVKVARLVQPSQADGITALPVTLVFADEAPVRAMLHEACGLSSI